MPGEVEVTQLEAALFSAGGAYVGELDMALAKSYRDQAGESGSARFTLLQSDPRAAQVAPRSIVKFRVFGGYRFGARVGKEIATYPENVARVEWECTGLLGALLSDAYVLPDSGTIRPKHTGERWFGFMSDFFDDASWTPVTPGTGAPGDGTLRYDDFADLSPERAGYPLEWPSTTSWWMDGNGMNSCQLFRATMVVPTACVVRLFYASDEGGKVWVDGEKVFDTEHDEVGYTEMHVYDLGIMQPGSYQVAIDHKIKATPIVGDGHDACIFAATTVDALNQPDVVLLESSAGDGVWRYLGQPTANPRPGLARAAIIRRLVEEAASRGVQGCGLVNLGFTGGVDSRGEAWTDQITQAVNVAKEGLDEVALSLAEDVIDLEFDAATMTLHAWKRRGQDLSGGGSPVTIERAENVTDLRTTRTLNVATVMTAELTDESYVTRSHAAGLAAWGRIERGLALGASTPGTGQAQLDTQLENLSSPIDEVEASTALFGAVPYVDYGIGDTVVGPAHRTGATAVRCLALTVTQAEGQDWAVIQPDLAPDPTGAGA